MIRFSRHLASLDPLYVSLEHGPVVEQLRHLGHEVVILESRDPRGVTRESGWFATGRAAVELARLGNRLAEMDVGLVVPHSLKAGAVAAAASRSGGAPLVWWIHDRMDAGYMGRAKATAARTFVRNTAAGVIVNSRSTFDALGRPRHPTLLMPPSVDVLAESGPVHERVSDAPLSVAMVGRLSPWKGQRVLMDALAALPTGVVGSCDVYGAPLFGEQDYADELHAAVEARGLRSLVTLHGHVPDASKRLTAIDVLVHASVLPEPFGAVVVEGLAAGCVVVAAAAGGPAEVITHGVDGLLYEPGDAYALATVLQSARTMTTDERHAMAERGRATARRYTTDRLGPQLADWLDTWRRGERPPSWTDGVQAANPR